MSVVVLTYEVYHKRDVDVVLLLCLFCLFFVCLGGVLVCWKFWRRFYDVILRARVQTWLSVTQLFASVPGWMEGTLVQIFVCRSFVRSGSIDW